MASDLPNPKGWEQLEALVRTGGSQHIVLQLRQPGSLLELQGGRVALFAVQPAPDGEYPLQVSGRLVVKGGRFQGVLGTPSAAVSADPVD